MKDMERVCWRCRRGLLELDIVLGRFIEHHYSDLDEAQLTAFDVLLDMSDNDLWDMIAGRNLTPVLGEPRKDEPRQDEQGAVLKLLQAV